MELTIRALLTFLTLLTYTHAIVVDLPAPTNVWGANELFQGAVMPEPTKGPSMAELLKRQAAETSVSNLIVASDGTCGFISGSAASPFGLCCSTCSCGFQTTNGWGKFYCCNSAACESRVPTTCIGAAAYTSNSACDSACQADSLTMKCTAAPYVYCNLAEFETVSVQALFCDSVTKNSTQSIYTTYTGQVGRAFTSWRGPLVTTTSTSPASSSSSSTSSSSSSSSSSTSTTSGGGGGGGSGAPIGAIVGGVVGGVAALAIVAGLIWYCMRKTRHIGDPDPAVHSHVAATTPQGGHTSMSQAPGGYGPGVGVDVAGAGLAGGALAAHEHEKTHAQVHEGAAQNGPYGIGNEPMKAGAGPYGGPHQSGYGAPPVVGAGGGYNYGSQSPDQGGIYPAPYDHNQQYAQQGYGQGQQAYGAQGQQQPYDQRYSTGTFAVSPDHTGTGTGMHGPSYLGGQHNPSPPAQYGQPYGMGMGMGVGGAPPAHQGYAELPPGSPAPTYTSGPHGSPQQQQQHYPPPGSPERERYELGGEGRG